ncbi:hypothetical protein [Rhodococcus sp. KRD162]|uniref:hypothetical protein n=1 Tax=Rhodococcus sp. KRD162 TaxID=2729725 RepID=UPI0019D2A427|nr:hypothetical protein [Rhodococcus sp. KRD162]
MNIVDPFTEIDWLSFDDEQDRHIEGLFGCGNLSVTVEARVDGDGTIPFVAVRTDPETMLNVDGIDRLLEALTSARQDLLRVAGDL